MSVTSYVPYLFEMGWRQEGDGEYANFIGTATGNTTTTSTEDTAEAWTVDAWIGATVHVWNAARTTKRGSAAITDNDATTLTHAAITGHTSTDVYEIVAENMTTQQAKQTNSFGIINEAVSLPDPVVDWTSIYTIGGNRDAHFITEGAWDMRGTIPFTMQSAKILSMVWPNEAYTANTPSSGFNTHVLTAGTWDPSMAIEVQYAKQGGTPTFYRYYSGVKIDRATFTADEKGFLKASFDVIAMNAAKTTNSASSITTATTHPYKWYHGAVSVLGVGMAEITSFSLEVRKNLDPKYFFSTINAKKPSTIIPGREEYELKVGLIATDTTLFDELVSGTADGTTAIMIFTRTSGEDTLRFTMANCQVISAPHGLPATEGYIPVELTLIPKTVTVQAEDATTEYLTQ